MTWQKVTFLLCRQNDPRRQNRAPSGAIYRYCHAAGNVFSFTNDSSRLAESEILAASSLIGVAPLFDCRRSHRADVNSSNSSRTASISTATFGGKSELCADCRLRVATANSNA